MPVLESWVLWLHIIAGTIAVLAGSGALVTTKGGWRHRQAGKIFVGSMSVVVTTVFVLLVIDPGSFRIILALVAIFSGYFAFSGYRVLSRNRPNDQARAIDWIAMGLVVVTCLGMGVWGLDWVLDGAVFGIVMVVFGGIGVVFGTLDAREFKRNRPNNWVVNHLQRMVAAFIATISAVSAVNLTEVIGIVAWLWPTLVGVPFIMYWSNTYARE